MTQRTPVAKTMRSSGLQGYATGTPESTRLGKKWWDGNSTDVGPLSVFNEDEWRGFVEQGKTANGTDRRQLFEQEKKAFHHYVRRDVDPALKDGSTLKDVCISLRRLEYRCRYLYDIMSEGKQITDTDQTEYEHIKEITDDIKERTYIQKQDLRRKKKEQEELEKTLTATKTRAETSEMPLEQHKQVLGAEGGQKELGTKFKPGNPLNRTMMEKESESDEDNYFYDSNNEELIGNMLEQVNGKINRFLVELERYAASQGNYTPRSELVALITKTMQKSLENEEEAELSLLLRAFSKKRMEEALIVWSRESKGRTEMEFKEITRLLTGILENWDKIVQMGKDNTKQKTSPSFPESPYPVRDLNKPSRRSGGVPKFPGSEEVPEAHSTPFPRFTGPSLGHTRPTTPTGPTLPPGPTGFPLGATGTPMSGEQNLINQLGYMFGNFANMMNRPQIHSNIKLPALEVPVFAGDILQFPTYWESYNPLIHSNAQLSPEMKLLHLRKSLSPEIQKTLFGSAGENLTYSEAIKIVFSKYCNPKHVTYAFRKKFRNMTAPNSRTDIRGCRQFVDTAKRYMTTLRLFNLEPEDYAMGILDDLRESIPKPLQYDLAAQEGQELSNLDLPQFIKSLDRYCTIREDTDLIHSLSNSTNNSNPTRFTTMSTTQQKPQVKAKRPCLFCGQIHYMADCTVIRDPLERFRFFQKNLMCTACTSKAHNFRQCTNTRRCWGTKGMPCRQHHHTSLHGFFARNQNNHQNQFRNNGNFGNTRNPNQGSFRQLSQQGQQGSQGPQQGSQRPHQQT